MAEKHKNIALFHITEVLDKNPLHPPDTLFAGGMTCDFSFLPENILVWKSSSELSVTNTSIHQRMILKIILSGEVVTIVDGIRIPMRAGDMIVFFPFQFHSTKLLCPPADYSFLAVTFTEKNKDYSAMHPLKNHLLSLDRQDAENVAHLIRNNAGTNRMKPEKTVFPLLELLLNQRRKIQNIPSENPDLPREMFDRICDYFRSNYDRKISLKTVAAEFQVSEETIRRMFHEVYAEITPGKLIRRLRMQMAIELLEHTEEPIASIARKCGYADGFVFSRAFKHMTGRSPLNHRKEYRNSILP